MKRLAYAAICLFTVTLLVFSITSVCVSRHGCSRDSGDDRPSVLLLCGPEDGGDNPNWTGG